MKYFEPDEWLAADLLQRVLGGRGVVHMIGMGGIGMAGLAFLLSRRGFQISGCDTAESRVTQWLALRGISVQKGHDPKHLGLATDWAIRTPAVKEDNPELLEARRLFIPVFQRGMVLPALLEGRTSLAVSGTHGKTTTTAMIAHILRASGRDPSFFVGGEWDADGGMADEGKGGFMVVEADESDGTVVYYHPDIAVITNIEYDHMENFESEAGLIAFFRRFAGNARRHVVYCADDPRALEVCQDFENSVSCGLSERSNVRGVVEREDSEFSQVLVEHFRRPLGSLRLPAPGLHNVRNALTATAAGLQLGMSFEEIRKGLESFRPVRRRFDQVVEARGIRVISDYAHHPTEIRALVQTALRLPHRRLLAVFQPHRYTRTLALGPDFPPGFEGIEELVLAPVYEASEKPLAGGTSADLAEHFKARGEISVRLVASLEKAWETLRPLLKAGDVLLVIGAGDVEKIAYWARDELMDVRRQGS
ncbi:MAG: UDP-N-acetylmuramate--L-alanine ligase [Lentisphaerota bacterium]